MDTNLDTICWHLKQLRDRGEAPAEIDAAFAGLSDRLARIEQDLADLMENRPQRAAAAHQATQECEDYRELRDVIIEELDPDDDDVAEVAILAEAVRQVKRQRDALLAAGEQYYYLLFGRSPVCEEAMEKALRLADPNWEPPQRPQRSPLGDC